MPKAPITSIIFGTMTLGYRGYGARVHDAATADAMLGAVLEFGHDQLDTCSVYGDGTCEQMLGDLRAAERFGIATRIHSGNTLGHVHSGNTRGHEPENLKRVFKESLARLKTDKVKILYLVTPDSTRRSNRRYRPSRNFMTKACLRSSASAITARGKWRRHRK